MGLLPTAKLSSQSDRQSGRQTSNNVAGTLYPDPMRTSTTSCRCTTVNITMCLTYPMSVWDTVTYHDVIMSHVTCHMHCSHSSDVKQSPALGKAHQAIQVSWYLNWHICTKQRATALFVKQPQPNAYFLIFRKHVKCQRFSCPADELKRQAGKCSSNIVILDSM